MTLQEAKDQVAKDCGFEDWEHIFSSYNLQKIEQITDEAAELYARSKWDEGILRDRIRLRGLLCFSVLIKHLPEPPRFTP